MSITHQYALDIAKKIMAVNPHYLLCGSNALLLVKAIPEREVLDIDFGQDTEKSIKTIDNLSSQYEQRIRDLESQTRLP